MAEQIDIGNVYNPNGKIVQIEYAKKCVDKSNTVISIKNRTGIVMAVLKPKVSKLDILEEDYQIHRISDNCYVAATGMIPDAAFMIHMMKEFAKEYENAFKEEISGEYLRVKLNEYLYLFTQNLGLRVIGANFLIMKREEAGKGYSLYHADNTGKVVKFRGFVMGSMQRRAQTEIEKLDLESLSTEEMIDSVVKIFYQCFDPLSDKEFGLEIGVISDESSGKFVRLETDVVERYMQKYSDLSIDDNE